MQIFSKSLSSSPVPLSSTLKFKAVKPKVKWSAQKVYQKMSIVRKDIFELNREMNSIDGIIRDHTQRKQHIKRKISNKSRYLHQLKEQLKET